MELLPLLGPDSLNKLAHWISNEQEQNFEEITTDENIGCATISTRSEELKKDSQFKKVNNTELQTNEKVYIFRIF